MIIGTGTDIIALSRIRDSIEKYGAHFLNYAFTEAEQGVGEAKGEMRFAFYGGRWAAKEAIAKALGTGFGAQCGWQDLCVLNDALGKPSVQLSGKAAETAAALGIRRWHLSISHEKDYAIAMAIAEN